MKEQGKDVTIAGCVMLRFARNGLCSELRDYWVTKEGKREPPGAVFANGRKPSRKKGAPMP